MYCEGLMERCLFTSVGRWSGIKRHWPLEQEPLSKADMEPLYEERLPLGSMDPPVKAKG